MSDFKGKQKSRKLAILHILVRFLFKSDSMSNNSCIFAPEWQNRRYSRIGTSARTGGDCSKSV